MPPSRPLVLRLLLLALPALLVAGCGAPTDAPPPISPDVWRGTDAKVEVEVSDLHCESCQARAEKTLAGIEGVQSVTADHASDVIHITLEDPSTREASILKLREEIHTQGWKVVGEDLPRQAD